MGPLEAVREGPEEPLELFDLTVDPGEENNVAAENRAVVDAVRQYLDRAVTPLPAD